MPRFYRDKHRSYRKRNTSGTVATVTQVFRLLVDRIAIVNIGFNDMRVKRLLTIMFIVTPALAQAITFQTRIEDVQWQVDGDRFECRLTQPIKGFGGGAFVRRAGEKVIFRVQTQEAWLSRGNAQLYAAAAPWQSAASDLQLGTVAVTRNERALESNQTQAGRLLTGLLEGRSPVVRHRTVQGEPLELRIMPTNFAQAYDDYLKCTTNLLPVNYDQIKQSIVRFDSGYDLSEQTRKHLDVLLEYMAEDKTVNRVLLDGHSDSSGDRLLNRDVSRRRALAVQAYLMAKGIAEEDFVIRFHGERYPLKPNTNAANRAENRRVSIRLERIDEETKIGRAHV